MCINKIKYFRKLISCDAPAMRQDSRTKENINRAPAGCVVTILTSQEVYWKKNSQLLVLTFQIMEFITRYLPLSVLCVQIVMNSATGKYFNF